MNLTVLVLAIKALIDLTVGFAWWFQQDNAQAWMFIGFAIADMACLAVAMR